MDNMSSQYQPPWFPMQPPPQYSQQTQYASQGQEQHKPAFGGKYTEVAIDEHVVAPYRKQTFKQKYFGGVKRTLRAFAAVGCVVLVVNLSWLGYARSHYGIVDGFGVIRQGVCSEVKNLSTWYHLLINILSTLLLTGSNAFMAVYSCPSRQEVDRAHQRGRVLNVGGLSFGNLRGISKRKGIVVVLLAMSSIHFICCKSTPFWQISSDTCVDTTRSSLHRWLQINTTGLSSPKTFLPEHPSTSRDLGNSMIAQQFSLLHHRTLLSAIPTTST